MKHLFVLASILLTVSSPSKAAILGGTLLTHNPSPASMFDDAVPIGWAETPIGALYDGFVTGGWAGAFDEKQAYLLNNTLSVDVLTSTDGPGSIPAGTRINSHMVFMDPKAGGAGSLEHFTVLFQFGERIAGTIFAAPLLNSSNYLGSPATSYPTFVAGQSIEASDIVLVDYDPIFDLSFVQLSLRDNGPGDWIRVITVSPVPLPPTAFAFLPGILLLAWLRRS